MDPTVLLDMLLPRADLLSDTSNLFFFREIFGFLSDELDEFRDNLLGRSMAWVGGLALVLMTLWIALQGYRIATGQSREPMMVFVTNALRATLIVSVATSFAVGGSSLSAFLTDDLNKAITHLVTGRDENAYDSIDRSLGYMQVALSSIDRVNVGDSEVINDTKTRNLWFTGVGIAGPALTGGAMLLLNKIAMALVVGLGPLFILCLLFEQTRSLFQRWLWYGIGTLFSLAVLSVMVALALDAVLAVTAAFWAGSFLGGSAEGINSLALQQGGLGLILTVLIVSAPPMAATFFNGTLGQFYGSNVFGGDGGRAAAGAGHGGGGGAGRGGSAYPPGHPGSAGQSAGSQAAPEAAGHYPPAMLGRPGAATQAQPDAVKPWAPPARE